MLNRCISSVSHERQKRIVRMLVIVVVLFAVCWLPYHILFLFMDFGEPPMTYSIVAAITSTQWFIYANSAFNPIVYAVFNVNYRREFSRMLRCQKDGFHRAQSIRGRGNSRSPPEKCSFTYSNNAPSNAPTSYTKSTVI